MSENSKYKFEVLICSKCDFTCYTLNKLQEHNLDKHPLPFTHEYIANLKYSSTNGFSYREVKDDNT